MSSANPPFPREQYQALRGGFGVVELTNWSSVTLTGSDRQKFLNGFCTNDVKRLVVGEHCEAFLTNVKGKVIGHGVVDCRENELVLISVPNQAAAIIEHLDRYIIREDVTLRDTTADRAYLLVAGGNDASNCLADEYSIGWRILQVSSCRIVETNASDQARVRQAAADTGAVACGDAAFNAVRIESGTPLFGSDFNAENLPREVGRNKQAICFAKGCYLGQETVARIDALGHVNQQLRGVRFAGSEIPVPGTELTSLGKPSGHVTSAAYSPLLSAPLALALLPRVLSASGTKLSSNVGDCEVLDLAVQP